MDPDQGHLRKQDWNNDLGQSRPETANSTEAGTGEQLLREWTGARELCGFRHESGTYEGVGRNQRLLWVQA